jgi:hypothetical protein
MAIFNFWKSKRATVCSHIANSRAAHTFEPYSDEKLENGGPYVIQPCSHCSSRPASVIQIAYRRLGWVLLILILTSLTAHHFRAVKPSKPSISTDLAVPLPPSAIDSTATTPPQVDLRPASWLILTYNDTGCEATNKSDKITGTGPSKCIVLGHGDDITSIHWAPDPKEDLKACYYEDRCSGTNATVNRGGCASPGFVGYTVKVIGFFEDC